MLKRVPAIFFATLAGAEPVREFLKRLSDEDRLVIGRDIAKVEFGWPIGMPTARQLGDGLHEVRSVLPGGRIARVFFYIGGVGRMVLLHAFIKKTQKTPIRELAIARGRMKQHRANG